MKVRRIVANIATRDTNSLAGFYRDVFDLDLLMDLDEALDRVRSRALPIEYGPVTEPWGARRFFVRDPAGTLLNDLVHG